jgi:hypothetical protein
MEIQPLNFIHLEPKMLGEYDIIYHINDCYSIKRLTEIQSKNQLLFQKYSSEIQQMNLIFVDSIFPILLADVALETFLKRISLFREYINFKKEFCIGNFRNDSTYLNYKFKSYINYFLFTNISARKVCNGEIPTDVIYYSKNNLHEIIYYSIYERSKLMELLLDKIHLKINISKSTITKEKVSLNLQIRLVI